MKFKEGQLVRILESAFSGSDDESDQALRGRLATLSTDLELQFGEGWAGCWEAIVDNNVVNLAAGEFEIVVVIPLDAAIDILNILHLYGCEGMYYQEALEQAIAEAKGAADDNP